MYAEALSASLAVGNDWLTADLKGEIKHSKTAMLTIDYYEYRTPLYS